MLKNLILPACFVLAFSAQAQAPLSGPGRYETTFIKDRQRLPDEQRQARLRALPGWQAFLQAHPLWRVEFNELSGLPRRAFGPGIPTTGLTPSDRASSFLSEQAARFHFDMDELVARPVITTSKHHLVRFFQRHEGMDVLWSNASVNMDLQGRVVSFALNVHRFPQALPVAVATEDQLRAAASAGVLGSLTITVEPEAQLLPVPEGNRLEMHLVRELRVRAEGAGIPGDLYCLVDATSGALLYRSDRVRTEHDHAPGGRDVGADVNFVGTVSHTIPDPSVVMPLRNLNFIADGSNFTTDPNGFAATGITGPISYDAELSGTWGTVFTNNQTPTLTGTLQEGANEVSFDGEATEQEVSAYYHVNNIHDQGTSVLPGFTGMDFDLEINVDRTDGDCNAFYDGLSINFYAEANDCYSLALVNDVVYHEYGHGINDHYYQDNGSDFNNGAMNEGYADVWAFSLSLNPILAQGYQISTPNASIRRYDEEPKVYPVDIVGEVHADGEIIAGAWWDLYENLGDMGQTMDLFSLAFAGLQAEAGNGDEGDAFRDVLIDVLEADDDDANLFNSTPNGTAITEAFAEHGITLLTGFDVIHTPVESSPFNTGILIEASAPVSALFDPYVQGVQLSYRINQDIWQHVMMTNVGGDNYEYEIPGQPVGTLVSYYIGILDVGNALSGVTPIGAAQAEPNLPYFILVGFDLKLTDNVDNVNELGNWELGMPGDNNTTGGWLLFDPNPTYSTVDGSVIQTGDDHTETGTDCFFTGNGIDENAPGENDVDAGHTTLQSEPIDLSAYQNPTITLYRWYTNSPPGGANPGMDWWHVQMSTNGVNWTYVENTRTDDRSWRRLAFRVQDYMGQSGPVTLRFIASDSTHLGQELDGGSLIEAAVDDIQVWDNAIVGVEESDAPDVLIAYPEPASEVLHVRVDGSAHAYELAEVLDPEGRVVMVQPIKGVAPAGRITLDVDGLSAGGYVLRLRGADRSIQKRFSVVR